MVSSLTHTCVTRAHHELIFLELLHQFSCMKPGICKKSEMGKSCIYLSDIVYTVVIRTYTCYAHFITFGDNAQIHIPFHIFFYFNRVNFAYSVLYSNFLSIEYGNKTIGCHISIFCNVIYSVEAIPSSNWKYPLERSYSLCVHRWWQWDNNLLHFHHIDIQ